MTTCWLSLGERKNINFSTSQFFGWFTQKETNCTICSQKCKIFPFNMNFSPHATLVTNMIEVHMNLVTIEHIDYCLKRSRKGCERALSLSQCQQWELPHGTTRNLAIVEPNDSLTVFIFFSHLYVSFFFSSVYMRNLALTWNGMNENFIRLGIQRGSYCLTNLSHHASYTRACKFHICHPHSLYKWEFHFSLPFL